MLLFRSEEHVTSWCEERRIPPGGTLTPDQGWQLARAWFHDRLEPGWRRRTPDEASALFTSLGLTDPFWRLPGVSTDGPADTAGS
jgi:hypothetical protein